MTKKPCFECDGTGLKCDVCGESEAACQCDEETMKSECGGCDGTGVWDSAAPTPPAGTPNEET